MKLNLDLKYSGLDEQRQIGRYFLRELSSMIFDDVMDGNIDVDEDKEKISEVERMLNMFEIVDIWYSRKNRNIVIKLGRPGILIGHHGKDIERLQKRFITFAKKYEIELDEKHPIDIQEDRRPLKEDLLHSVICWGYANSPDEDLDDYDIYDDHGQTGEPFH